MGNGLWGSILMPLLLGGIKYLFFFGILVGFWVFFCCGLSQCGIAEKYVLCWEVFLFWDFC